jgi:adenylate cyclase
LGLGYLGNGVNEDIISMLSRFPDLSVVTRNSSFVYNGKPVDMRQIGRDLDVGCAREGSVRGSAHGLDFEPDATRFFASRGVG